MNLIIRHLLFYCFLFQSLIGLGEDSNKVKLHIQLYDAGICRSMTPLVYSSTSRYQKTKSVFQSGAYYSTMYAGVCSADSSDLSPEINHERQSISLLFNPKLDYKLVLLRYNGFDRSAPDSMVIKISKLNTDAQLIIPFKKGKFSLQKMKHFKKLKTGMYPEFRTTEATRFKNSLKLDSTAYFSNGKTKAKYYLLYPNFPLYFVREFDQKNLNCYAQGFRLIQNQNIEGFSYGQGIWSDQNTTKYGYWEYFENDKRVKHEMWASVLQEKFEWYLSGQLKYATYSTQPNREIKHIHYLENGAIEKEFYTNPTSKKSYIRRYSYSPQGKIILISTYESSNGISKQGLRKRELFYPSGKLKMEENHTDGYSIKYYNEDGSERIN